MAGSMRPCSSLLIHARGHPQRPVANGVAAPTIMSAPPPTHTQLLTPAALPYPQLSAAQDEAVVDGLVGSMEAVAIKHRVAFTGAKTLVGGQKP